MLPFASTAGAPPDIHTPPLLPLGEVLNTASWASVVALYDMTQPCQGEISQCEPQLMITWPLVSASAARWFSCLGLKVRTPPLASTALPGTEPCIGMGPPNFSASVVTSRACRYCTREPLTLDFATT